MVAFPKPSELMATIKGLARGDDVMIKAPVLLNMQEQAIAPAATQVFTSGLFRTLAGAQNERAFLASRLELREYLAIRLGSVEAARAAIIELGDTVENCRADELKKAPSPKAGLYLLARGISELRRLLANESAVQRLGCNVPWAAAPYDAPRVYRDCLELLRMDLSTQDAELLELYVVRGLSVAELAYVLGASRAQVETRLTAARAWAEMLVRDRTGTREIPFEQLLHDAFRLLPFDEAAERAQGDGPAPVLGKGTMLANRYSIDAHVGGGAFGNVYRAQDVLVPGHVVALKVMHKKAQSAAAREGAMRELSLTASVFHPSIVQFKDHGWHDERLWFVMPWYEGETLQKRIAREPLSRDEALLLFEQLARALGALHATGIRHQDVKPENVFLANVKTGRDEGMPDVLPVLLDLGGAASSGDMALAGTPMYFAPEVAQRFVAEDNTIPLTDRADVFALALTLMHALDPNAVDSSAGADFDTFVRQRAESTPTVPHSSPLKRLRKHFERWLSFDAPFRPSASELADELAALRAGRSPRKKRRRSAGRRNGWLAFACAGMLAGGVVTAAIHTNMVPGITTRSVDAQHTERVQRQVYMLETELRTLSSRAEQLERELMRARTNAQAPTKVAPPAPDQSAGKQ